MGNQLHGRVRIARRKHGRQNVSGHAQPLLDQWDSNHLLSSGATSAAIFLIQMASRFSHLPSPDLLEIVIDHDRSEVKPAQIFPLPVSGGVSR